MWTRAQPVHFLNRENIISWSRLRANCNDEQYVCAVWPVWWPSRAREENATLSNICVCVHSVWNAWLYRESTHHATLRAKTSHPSIHLEGKSPTHIWDNIILAWRVVLRPQNAGPMREHIFSNLGHMRKMRHTNGGRVSRSFSLRWVFAYCIFAHAAHPKKQSTPGAALMLKWQPFKLRFAGRLLCMVYMDLKTWRCGVFMTEKRHIHWTIGLRIMYTVCPVCDETGWI